MDLCKICGENPSATFNMKGKTFKRGKCDSCHNELVKRRRLEKLVEKNPELYYDCDDCDHIQSKRFSKKGKCIKCGSTNLVEAE